MPENIGNHGLYCPDFDDYAAVALYMQDLGTKIDAALTAQQDALNDFLNTKCIIVTNSVSQTIASFTGDTSVFDTVLFNNSSFFSYADEGGIGILRIGSAAGVSPIVPYPKGSYTYGINVRFTDLGAPTVGSTRAVAAFVFDETAIIPDIRIDSDFAISANTGGGDGVLVQNSFRLDGINGIELQHIASNSDPAISVSITPNNAYLWCMYNGPTDVIEVA